MNIILDTRVFLWAISDPERIEAGNRGAIETRANTVWISAISFAELAIKASIGKFELNFNPLDAATQSGFDVLDFGADAAVLLKDLPLHHRDPFDRMIIAQAISLKYRILSYDQMFTRYDCKLL